MIRYDSRGIKPSTGGFDPIPEGDYVLEITEVEETESRKGNPMVKVTQIVSEGQYKGKIIWNQITLLPKGEPGAGIALHFLKSIGEPWEEKENLDIDPERWKGKRFKAHVIQDTYTKPDGSKITNNKIKGIEPLDEIPF